METQFHTTCRRTTAKWSNPYRRKRGTFREHLRRLHLESLEQRTLLTVDLLGAWVEQGPGPIVDGHVNVVGQPNNPAVGAIEAIAVDPNNLDIAYVGAVNGGIWKTTNVNDTNPSWTPLSDQQESLSISSLAFHPDNSNTLYVGTSNKTAAGWANGAHAGILKTTDGGTTWTQLGREEFKNVSIHVVPATGQVVMAAAATHYEGNDFLCNGNRRSGLWRSTDGGANWVRLTLSENGIPEAYVTHLVADPGNADRFYAAVPELDNLHCGATRTTLAGIYRSEDSGANWVRVGHTSMQTDLTDTARIELALGEPSTVNADDSPVYAALITWSSAAGAKTEAIYRSANQGNSWVEIQNLPKINVVGQGFIHFSMLADRTDDHVLYVAGDADRFACCPLVYRVTVNEANPSLDNWEPLTGRQLNGNIFNATRTNPVVITDFNHDLFNGQQIEIKDVVGMTEINDRVFTIEVLTDHQFSLIGEDGTSHSAYVSGGTWVNIAGGANDTRPHVDSRDMVFDENGNILQSDDGGIYRLVDPGNVTTRRWETVSGRGDGSLRTVELWSAAYDSVNNVVFGSTHDNGSLVTSSAQVDMHTGLAIDTTTGLKSLEWRMDSGGEAGWGGTFGTAVGISETATGNIIGASRSNPVVITSTNHGLADGQQIKISGVNGMVEINDRFFTVVNATMNTFALLFENGTTHGVYTSGGTWTRLPVDRYFSSNAGSNRRWTFDDSNARGATRSFGDGGRIVTNAVDQMSVLYADQGNTRLLESSDRGDTASEIWNSPSQIMSIAYGWKDPLGSSDNPDAVYVGNWDGNVFFRDTMGSAFTQLRRFRGAIPVDIAIDPEDERTAYLIDDDSNLDQEKDDDRKVWRVRNAGTTDETWDQIGDFGNDIIDFWQSLEVVGPLLVAGTRGGVFATPVNNPGVWQRFGSGLPNAKITSLQYSAEDDILIVSTVGRGAWALPNASRSPLGGSYVTIQGIDGQDDTVHLTANALNPNLIDFSLNGISLSLPSSTVETIFFRGGDGDDTLTVDLSGGPFLVTPRILFRGDSDRDRLEVIGDADYELTARDLTLLPWGMQIEFRDFIEEALLVGGDGDNVIDASQFYDAGSGYVGIAHLEGHAGRDFLLGGAGSDTLSGGPGNDILDGGDGVDQVVESRDVDFVLTGDRLRIGSTEVDDLVFVEEVLLTGGPSDNLLDASGAFAPGNEETFLLVKFNALGGTDTIKFTSRFASQDFDLTDDELRIAALGRNFVMELQSVEVAYLSGGNGPGSVVNASGSGIAHIWGSYAELNAAGSSTINVYGKGSIAGSLNALDSSQVNIFGNQFSLNGVTAPIGEIGPITGTLTGQLMARRRLGDVSAIDVVFRRDDAASVVLHNAYDLNGDGVVDLGDRMTWFNSALVRFGHQIGQSGYDARFDFDGDGIISSRDYLFWFLGMM